MEAVTAAHAELLANGAKQLAIDLTDKQQRLLLAYLTLLVKWNKAYNLTAVRAVTEMVSRHLLDSLSVLPYARKGRYWLDVGSGGGMPGIPLAIMFPDKEYTLIDSNGKKTRFLTQVMLELKLINVHAVNERVEKFQVQQPYDGIVSRAFSSISNFLTLTQHLADQHTQWLAMKGVFPEEELRMLPSNFTVESNYKLTVPNCMGNRHLLVIKQSI